MGKQAAGARLDSCNVSEGGGGSGENVALSYHHTEVPIEGRKGPQRHGRHLSSNVDPEAIANECSHDHQTPTTRKNTKRNNNHVTRV